MWKDTGQICRKVYLLNTFVVYYLGLTAIYILLFVYVSALWKAARKKTFEQRGEGIM